MPIFKPLPINQGKFVVRFGAPVLALGIALGMLRSNSLQNLVTKPEVGTQPLLILAAGAATVIVLITIMALGNSDRWSRFFQPLVPFIAVTMFAIPFASAENFLLTSVFLLVGFLCFESLMWIFFGDLSQRFRLSPVFVFGLGRGILAFAILVGSLAPVAAANIAHNLPFGEETLVLAMLLVIVFAYALLPREREIEAIVVPCPLVKAVSASFERKGEAGRAAKVRGCGDAQEMTRVLENAAQRDYAEARLASQGNAAEAASNEANERADMAESSIRETGFDQVASTVSSDSGATPTAQAATAMQNEASAAAANETSAVGSDVAVDTQAGESDAHTGTANDDARTNAVPPAKMPVSTTRTNASQADSSVPFTTISRAPFAQEAAAKPANGNDAVRGGGRFRGKCETVANTFLLSRRETEILFLLAKGHNAAYIQEKLYISEGTAKTHIRHIYRKCDVHNQQDLMRMVEDAQPTE